MSDAIIIDVKNLRKSFDERVVVNDINLSVRRGEVFGFLGPNGSGKTTTIRMLCGLLTPDGGSGHCLGFDIRTQSENIRMHVGYMTQKFSLYTDLSVEENLRFVARIFGVENREARIRDTLEDLGLFERRHQLTRHLSGGWKQRLALSACLLHNPDVLLLDEPTAGVDPIARREFWDKIHALSERGVTTFVSTHYMDEAERCTRLAYLAYGDLIVTGTVDEVIAQTELVTWAISGSVTTALLQAVRQIEGVAQAALFGSRIHVSGYEAKTLEPVLHAFAGAHQVSIERVPSSLEDAFISLVRASQGEKH